MPITMRDWFKYNILSQGNNLVGDDEGSTLILVLLISAVNYKPLAKIQSAQAIISILVFF